MGAVVKKDDKVEYLSLEDFLKFNCQLDMFEYRYLENGQSLRFGHNYKITKKFFVDVFVKRNSIFAEVFGGKDWKIDCIKAAQRDEKLEKDIFDGEIDKLVELSKTKRLHYKQEEKLDKLKKIKRKLKQVDKAETSIQEESNFIHINEFECQSKELASHYLVLDVETNGLRTARDDLLSITIFDPFSGICYNRFLPLDLQPIVLTSDINGITNEELEHRTHISQRELDELFQKFNVSNRTILTFSGGKGDFDKIFFENYCKRHNLSGYEVMSYGNIKSLIPSGGYGLSNQLSKDNLCNKLGISGVTNVHSGLNDCVLEWKLFERIHDKHLFFAGNDLYEYRKEYIVPVSYLVKSDDLRNSLGLKPFDKVGIPEEIFSFEFNPSDVRKIKKYSTNVTGIAFEHALNSKLNAKKEDNLEFLAENKSNLSLLCSFETKYHEIRVSFNDDGTMTAINNNDKTFIDDVNSTTKIIIEKIDSVINYLKDNIFNNCNIASQELVLWDKPKVLALCDLSSNTSVVEIKTYRILDKDGHLASSVAEQLFYEAKGRDAYCLTLEFKEHCGVKNPHVIDGIFVKVYKITYEKFIPKPIYGEYVLNKYDVKVLNAIIECPTITNKELMKVVGCSINCINMSLYELNKLKYIQNVGNRRYRNFAILRNADDLKTSYEYFEGEFKILS